MGRGIWITTATVSGMVVEQPLIRTDVICSLDGQATFPLQETGNNIAEKIKHKRIVL